MSDEQRPIIVPDPELGLAVSWQGSSTFHILRLEGEPMGHPGARIEEEVGVFTHYGNDNGDPPDVMHAYAIMQDWLDEQHFRETEAYWDGGAE